MEKEPQTQYKQTTNSILKMRDMIQYIKQNGVLPETHFPKGAIITYIAYDKVTGKEKEKNIIITVWAKFVEKVISKYPSIFSILELSSHTLLQ